ncbi:putative hydroxymethylpyrimidine transporter CytX [Rouxiella sp. S1S-2]|uniref:putative hydroxymethylpyrimidine transporter CytX n=1 Tax=Rouxiella sp. S1S-2 TaxID=2653856 RepID=UPI00126571E9|nr:putative hydroxymethylpyrimidine transporter CytX [Rouxiella sp. S1S-2]KAB7894837.1 putative hydroxymethylpyrimidine transporter CytX [Rouxiella sp. S1S-2]
MKNNSIYTPARPVSAETRVLGWRDLFSLWFSLGMGLMVLQAGAILAPGLGMAGSLLAIFTGTLVGVILLALVGVIGGQTGLSSMSSLTLSLGKKGIALPALFNILQLIGWGAFEIVVMRDAASLLAKQAWGAQSFWANPTLWTLIFGFVATLLAVCGPLAFIRVVLRRWGIWLLIGSCIWLTVNLFQHASLSTLWHKAGDGSMPFALACDIVVSMALSWLPLVSDYTRFGKSSRQNFLGTACGFFLGSLWMMALGAAYTLAFVSSADSNALLLALSGVALGIPLLLILVDEHENTFADIHSAALSGATLLPKSISIGKLSWGVGLICTLIAWGIPLDRYENFLLLIGSVFAPLFGVVLMHYFILRHRQPAESNMNWRALSAWVIGIVTYHLIAQFYPNLGATVPSLLVAALFCRLLSKRRA